MLRAKALPNNLSASPELMQIGEDSMLAMRLMLAIMFQLQRELNNFPARPDLISLLWA
tara:strand:- start:20 stop:193 length:174 start_codon:yes stop_codon:yes gene_type:complete